MLKTITLLLLTVAAVGATRLEQVVPRNSTEVAAVSQRGGLLGRWRRGPTQTSNQRSYYRGNTPSSVRNLPMMMGG